MNEPLPLATALVLLITGVATLLAFHREDLKERWLFKPFEILQYKQFDRLLTSGLIHADGMHFGLNAYSFYSFGSVLELLYGPRTMLLIYVLSILAGSLLSLAIHRHEDYRALGASGGVCGVMFASIFLLPGGHIRMFLLPIGIPAYVYAIGFLALSFVALRRGRDRIGHDAHLGGAICGLLTAAALHPEMALAAPTMFSAVLGLSLLILIVLIFDPLRLWNARSLIEPPPASNLRYQRYDENRQRNVKMAEIDDLLDQVAKKGIHSLSKSQRKKLERLSQELYGRK